MFDSYLRLGGIEAGQNTFTGGFDQDTLAGMSAEEIQTAQASDYISDAVLAADLDRNNLKDRLAQNEDVWAVDFTAIVKAFLSQHVPYVMCISAPEKQLEAAEMIKNFLNYLLQHDVAPEYEADILAARKICDKAFSEIPSCLRVSKLLPGTFNKACSTLYGGEYQGMYQRHEAVGSKTLRNPGMEAEEAIKIIKFTMVAMGQLKTKDDLAAAKKGFHVVETKTCGAEVVSIDLLPPEEKKIFEETKKQAGVEAEVLGRVRFREWDEPAHEAENVDESESEDDDDDEGAGGKRLAKRAAEWEIWLEVSLLESFFVGLKLFATWQRLNNGVWYLDEVTGCLVSFYTYLPLNERLKERAAHRGAAAGLLEPGKDGAGAVGDPGAAGEWDDYVEGDAERAMEKLKLEGGVDMDITIVGEEEAAEK